MGARQVDEETIRRWIAEGIANGGGGGSSYFVYTASASQAGTSVISVNEFQNTLDTGGIWTRPFEGVYRFTTTIDFVANKATVPGFGDFNDIGVPYMPIGGGAGAILGYYNVTAFSSGGKLVFEFSCMDASFVLKDLGVLIGESGLLFLPDFRYYP